MPFLSLGTVDCGSKKCRNGGQCVNGKCYCEEGYSGPECGEILMTLLYGKKFLAPCCHKGFLEIELRY